MAFVEDENETLEKADAFEQRVIEEVCMILLITKSSDYAIGTTGLALIQEVDKCYIEQKRVISTLGI